MWGPVLVLALFAALDPVRLGITLLLISRPRPVQNLLAYGGGGLVACIPTMAIPLTLLHVTKIVRSNADGSAHSTTSLGVRHIQIGVGALALSVAALIAVRLLRRSRQQARPPTPDGTTPTLVLDPTASDPVSRLLGHAKDAAAEGGSITRRLLGRAHSAWENGSLGIALLIGFGLGGPPLDGLPFLLAIVAASGAAIGTKVGALAVFVLGMFAVVEIVLVSQLAAPAKTQALLRELHDWALAHRPQVLAAILTLVGTSLVVRGLGLV